MFSHCRIEKAIDMVNITEKMNITTAIQITKNPVICTDLITHKGTTYTTTCPPFGITKMYHVLNIWNILIIILWMKKVHIQMNIHKTAVHPFLLENLGKSYPLLFVYLL